MVSKGILAAAAIVVILVIGGGMYMMQQPPQQTPTITPITPKPAATTPTQTPTTPETPTSTPSPTPTETPEETLPGPTLPMGTDEEQVEALVMAYIDAFDRNSAEDVAGCFTPDGIYSNSMTPFGTFIGHGDIAKCHTKYFTDYPRNNVQDLQIFDISVSGDKAKVLMQHTQTLGPKPNMKNDSNLTIVRVDGTWRIEKAFITYGH